MNADPIDYREEAARLALATIEDQRAVIAWLKDIAADPKVKKADRQLAGEKAKALESLLFPVKTRKKTKQ